MDTKQRSHTLKLHPVLEPQTKDGALILEAKALILDLIINDGHFDWPSDGTRNEAELLEYLCNHKSVKEICAMIDELHDYGYLRAFSRVIEIFANHHTITDDWLILQEFDRLTHTPQHQRHDKRN